MQFLSLGGISFAAPWAFAVLVPLTLWLMWRRRRRPPALIHARAALLASGPRRGQWTARLLIALRVLAIVALATALARPRTGARTETVRGDGISIVIALDVSSSMLAEDFQPDNRLGVAKTTAKEFIASRDADQVGLVAFAGEALTQVPLTLDYPVLLAAVGQLQPGVLRMIIHEGRNRQIRRMCQHVGYPVLRLARVRIGPISDRRLRPGEYRMLTVAEVRSLIEAVAEESHRYA